MNTKEKRKRTKTIAIAAIALVSILLAVCMTAAPAMAQETICWNDTFDDETKIAEKQYTIAKDGDVEIDFETPGWMWSRNSSISGCTVPTIAFNITGDGKWNMICGHWAPGGGSFSGYYWNGTQWIDDSSVVFGLSSGYSAYPAMPTIVFNITGDGKWNLINGISSGYYWNGAQWIDDSSVVSGLASGFGPKLEIAFNITGDGRWNAIIAEFHGTFRGYYWNGTQWISDSSVVSGLGMLGESPLLSVAFNITGDGRWNLIFVEKSSGKYRGFYWNEDQWVSDSSWVYGLDGYGGGMHEGMSIVHNLTGDGKWNVFTADSCFEQITVPGWTTRTPSITSQVIDLPAGNHWLFFFANDTTPEGTNITYNILDEWNNTLMDVVSGQVISDITDAKVRLFAELTTGDMNQTPVLHDWRIWCAEGLPAGGVLKEKKRLTFDPHSSTSPSVATDSGGSVHVVWTEDRSDWQIHFTKLAANGTVIINDTALPASGMDPTILIDPDDNLHVTFVVQPSEDLPDAYYMKMDNNGEMLIAPKKILSGVEEPNYQNKQWRRAFTIDSAGDIHAVEMYLFAIPCGNGRCVYETIRYIKFDNEGHELLNTTLVSFMIKPDYGWKASPSDAISIATDSDGSAHVVYNRGTAGGPEQLDIYYLKADSSGAVLEDMRLTTDSNESRYPVVCADATGNVHLIWRDDQSDWDQWHSQKLGNDWDIYYTKLGSNGDILIIKKQITFESSADSFGGSSIDTESGVVHVAWSDGSIIHYTALDTNGIGIVDRTLLSPPWHGTVAGNPSMDAVQTGLHLVWDEKREHDAGPEIYYARLFLPNWVCLMPPSDKWTAQDVVATYTIGILSTMSITETFNLTLDNPDGADVAELSDSTITLESYSVGEVTLNVTDSRVGDYRVTVTATSQTNLEIQDSATITTSVIVPIADLLITAVDAYHNDTSYPPYFNLSNEVDVKVENIGTKDAGTFNVELYVNDTLIDTQSVSDLGYGSPTTVQFKWTPEEGKDCEDDGIPIIYTLKAIADCDNVITESDETNNELTVQETVYWAGYSADEELVEASHGVIRGGLLYTTGDGEYVGLYGHGNFTDTQYNIELPANSSVKHAKLNVYYTWSKLPLPVAGYPVMEVSITNGATHESHTFASPTASYNDRPCDSPAISFEYPWGNYVYNLTSYITDSGSYTVRVKNNGSADNPSNFCIAAPGLVILYEDSSMPEYEYWILEGADVVEGGRRPGAGYLSLGDCTNDAVFPRSIDLSNVSSATVGMVSIWGGAAWGEWTSYYWFNDNYLGNGTILGGYHKLYDETIDGMSMYVGASGNAQVGTNVSDVTDYLKASGNIVTFGDNGDSMMPSNAFLLVERCRAEKPEPARLVPFMVSGFVFNYSDGTPINNPDVTIKNMNTGELFAVETRNGSNYYQILTSPEKVSCGDVLRFTCNRTSVKHRVRQSEIDAGGFEQNITAGMIEAIEAGVTFSPKKLDLNSNGVLKAYITLPEDYDVANISVSTVECEGAPVFGFGKVIPGKQALEVKFKIQNLTVPTGDAVLLTVTGELYEGTLFEASNTLKVV